MAAATITTSVVTGGTNSHQTVAEEVNNFATDFVTQGIVGSVTRGVGSTAGTGGFAVTQDGTPDMGVTVLLGRAYVACTPASQDAQVLNARMTTNYTAYTINSNNTGSTVYDWIYLKADATNAATPSVSADNVITLYTSRSTSNSSDNGSPPTYGYLLAVVTVANGASSITNSNIADKRVQCVLATGSSASTTGWSSTSAVLSYSANNGNKEFVLNSDTDLTGTVSPGMKLQVTRGTTPPTQCMAFTAASSQYATKASPSGITFTSAFTCEAWVYLNSYGSANTYIINRFDAAATTGGWRFIISSAGQVEITYGTTTSFTNFVTYQSLPLKQWIHIAGVVTSVASKTGAIYIDGASVPVSSGLTAATTLTQASVDLRVGAAAATPTNTYFDGYLSEVRVWSVAQTQTNIRNNMAISLTGSESNLVALFQGNGNFNDATTNANNLTATNGAVATQASNPYNAIEYAEVASITASTITVNCGPDGNIPDETLTSPYYSTSERPFGMPNSVHGSVYRRCITVPTGYTATSSTAAQVPGVTTTLTIPTGGQRLKISASGRDGYATTSGAILYESLWLGTVGSGTQIAEWQTSNPSGLNTIGFGFNLSTVSTLAAGSQTIGLGLRCSSGNAIMEAGITYPITLTVEAW